MDDATCIPEPGSLLSYFTAIIDRATFPTHAMHVPMNHSIPEDILRLIFDIFIPHCDRNDSLRLLSISRDVKTWIEPRIYSKVILRSSRQALAFAAALRGELAYCDPGRHVKSLWLLCTDLTVAQELSNVPQQCPNLVHFAFNGKWAPFSVGRTNNDEMSQLTRLSICSPSLLDLAVYNDQPPIKWERLTHLHILGPGDVNDYSLYDDLLGRHIDRLTSLEHLSIGLTYPSPETELIKYSFFAETSLFYIYVKDSIIRDMLNRIPSLQRIAIKTNFTYPRFKVLWNDLQTLLADVPQVSFEMKPFPDQDFYESTSQCSTSSLAVWQSLVQGALEEVEESWKANH